MSKIEWTDKTWNPITGCDKVSSGCKNCYAEKFAKRLQAAGIERYRNGFKLTVHEELIQQPYKWKTPSRVFVNSMSDIFHEKTTLSILKHIFQVMLECPMHQFQILTKRSKKLVSLSSELPWPGNVWMGVSVENSQVMDRIDDLRRVPATVRFLSCEPLLGPLDNLNLESINWVIVGGESGPRSRPIQKEWVLSIRDQCLKRNIPFFFKQWGGINKKRNGRLLEDKTWDEFPNVRNALL